MTILPFTGYEPSDELSAEIRADGVRTGATDQELRMWHVVPRASGTHCSTPHTEPAAWPSLGWVGWWNAGEARATPLLTCSIICRGIITSQRNLRLRSRCFRIVLREGAPTTSVVCQVVR
ncbi:hypothetical protein GW17_00058839 [Ensete ventricosum]|nr:hypothetical protein GW17_00058839 [Ensete ventricosum]